MSQKEPFTFDLDLDEFQRQMRLDPGDIDQNFEKWRNINSYVELPFDDPTFNSIATGIFNHLKAPSIRYQMQQAVQQMQVFLRDDARQDIFASVEPEQKIRLIRQFKLECIVQFCMAAEEFAILHKSLCAVYGEPFLPQRRLSWTKEYMGYEPGEAKAFYENIHQEDDRTVDNLMLQAMNVRDSSALPNRLQTAAHQLASSLREGLKRYFAENYIALLPLYNAHKHGYRVVLCEAKRGNLCIDGYFFPKTKRDRKLKKRVITGFATALITDRYQAELMVETEFMGTWSQMLLHFFEHGFNQRSFNAVAAMVGTAKQRT